MTASTYSDMFLTLGFIRHRLRAWAIIGSMPPRSSFTTNTLSTLHTRSTSCHPDLKTGLLGSRSLSLRSFLNCGLGTTLFLPGDDLASFWSAPSFLSLGWRSPVSCGGAPAVSGRIPAALATPSLTSPAGLAILLFGFRSR